jgi:hypothetical protein
MLLVERGFALCLSLLIVLVGTTVPADEIDYAVSIKPLLKARCYACHGALQQQNQLRLDTVELIKQGGDAGPAIAPGDSVGSLLLDHVLQRDGAARMPPESEGEGLSAAQIDLLTRWIDAGAPGIADEKPEADPRDHWAFKAPVRPALPGAGHPIDAFLGAAWKEHGLVPQRPAEPGLLLRRLYIDLIGLPPTAEQIWQFEQLPPATAYETTVDQLLASPQYGERWARHWMDVWRYSEWYGLGEDIRNSQPHLWHWRDWIVESLNEDKGYDQMAREMLAADELYPTEPKRLRATGYLVRNYFHFSRTTWLEEVVEHTSKGFLGLTLNCAKCHDHKYDPLKQEDFYRFRAFFEPYFVRTDLVDGELNFDKAGLPRAYDCYLDAPTYLFERGNESQPRKDHPLLPGVPDILAFEELQITAVALPEAAYAVGSQPLVVQSHLENADREIGLAAQGLADAKAQRAALEAADEDRTKLHDLAVEAAELQYAAAVAKRTAIEASAAADAAKLDTTRDVVATELARTATLKQREQELARSRAALAQARLQQTIGVDDATVLAEAVKEAEADVDRATKKLSEPDEPYKPLAGARIARTERGNDALKLSQTEFPKTSTGRRTALAKWLTDARNPLTARVAVNHIWLRHFGSPLVPNVFDFGRNAPAPVNQALLDWLSVEFMDRGWSMKHLHRLMVTSDAYRMTSSLRGADTATRAADPDNLYLWRMNPTRMQAQVVRDSLLQLSGELDLTLGGKSIPIDDESNRRGLYFAHSHNDRERFLRTFDDANVLECYRRIESIVPQQALALENSKLAMRTAERIARQHADLDQGAFIRAMFQLMLGYRPSLEEIAESRRGLREMQELAFNAYHPNPELQARINYVLALLNHNDFITVR